MKSNLTIKEYADMLLTPCETLCPELFENNKLRPDIKNQILSQVDFILSKTYLHQISGLKIKDIYLSGDFAGYFYNELSLIDIKIEISNEGCPFLTANNEDLELFCKELYIGKLADFKFRLNNRVVSFVFITDKPAFADLYSINRDKWIRMPSKESRKHLNVKAILEGFDNKYQRAKLQSNTVKQYDKHTCFDVEDIMQLYKSLTKSKDSSIYEHIVYKLLQASGILQDINQTIYTVTNSFLSL